MKLEKGMKKEIRKQQQKLSKKEKKRIAALNWVGGPQDPNNRPKPTTTMGNEGYVRHPKHKKEFSADD